MQCESFAFRTYGSENRLTSGTLNPMVKTPIFMAWPAKSAKPSCYRVGGFAGRRNSVSAMVEPSPVSFSCPGGRPPDIETNGVARRFVGGLPPMCSERVRRGAGLPFRRPPFRILLCTRSRPDPVAPSAIIIDSWFRTICTALPLSPYLKLQKCPYLLH
jgi:hypothetical protein